MTYLKSLLLGMLLAPAVALAQDDGETMDDPDENGAEAMEEAVDDTAEDMEGDNGDADMGADAETFVTAPPADAVLFGELEGNAVTNRNDEEIGEIQDMLIGRDGRVHGVLVSAGGFLGLGEKNVAISWNELDVAAGEDEDEYEVRVEIDRDSLEDAPEFDEDGMAGD